MSEAILDTLSKSLETAFCLLDFSAIYYEGVLTVRIGTITATFNDDGELMGAQNKPPIEKGGD